MEEDGWSHAFCVYKMMEVEWQHMFYGCDEVHLAWA